MYRDVCSSGLESGIFAMERARKSEIERATAES